MVRGTRCCSPRGGAGAGRMSRVFAACCPMSTALRFIPRRARARAAPTLRASCSARCYARTPRAQRAVPPPSPSGSCSLFARTRRPLLRADTLSHPLSPSTPHAAPPAGTPPSSLPLASPASVPLSCHKSWLPPLRRRTRRTPLWSLRRPPSSRYLATQRPRRRRRRVQRLRRRSTWTRRNSRRIQRSIPRNPLCSPCAARALLGNRTIHLTRRFCAKRLPRRRPIGNRRSAGMSSITSTTAQRSPRTHISCAR